MQSKEAMKARFSYSLVGGTNLSANSESQERFGKGQKQWVEFSEKTINDAVDLLPALENSESCPQMLTCKEDLQATKFGRLLLFFAGRRQEIANELAHGATDINQKGVVGRTQEYGDIRFYSSLFSSNRMAEVFKRDSNTWPSQWKAVFAAIDQMLNVTYSDQTKHTYSDDNYRIEARPGKEWYDETFFYIIFKSKLPQNVALKSKHYSTETIEYRISVDSDEQTDKPTAESMRIEYTKPDKYCLAGDIEIANYYLESLLQWRPENGLEEFMKSVGQLAHITVGLLPVRLGTAATTEWMLRAVAFHKGIILGDFNQNNGVSWDFKALITPDREGYAKWFTENVFNSIRMIDKPDVDLLQGMKSKRSGNTI